LSTTKKPGTIVYAPETKQITIKEDAVVGVCVRPVGGIGRGSGMVIGVFREL